MLLLQALEINSNSVKALYTQAKAYIGSNRPQQAIPLLQRASKNPECSQLLEEAQQLVKKLLEEEKAFWKHSISPN